MVLKFQWAYCWLRPATSGELNQSAPENGQLASFQLVDVAAEQATEAAKGFFFSK